MKEGSLDDSLTHKSPASWFTIWRMALLQPSTETYLQIANDPNSSRKRGEHWVFWSAMASVILLTFISQLLSLFYEQNELLTEGSPTILVLVCGGIVAGFWSVLIFAIYTSVTNIMAKWMGGDGNYATMIYTNAAYYAPLSLITAILWLIPIVQLFSGFIMLFYMLALNVLSVKAVHHLKTKEAVMVGFAPLILFGVLVASFVNLAIAGFAILS